MENIKMILSNGTEIAINDFQIPMHVVIVGTREELVGVWEQLTPTALESISISLNGSNLITQLHAALENVQFVENALGNSYTAHFYFSGEHAVADNSYTTAARILLGEVE